ncbi:MAG: hypothetical protein QHH75_11560 [Bacillota bacterium]|jgi:DNA repair exonuclease SbcCD ATPase subunit|nr:hypothetical protein [Bacillota bacterium]
MRILEIKSNPVGPLSRPVLFKPRTTCTVVYDENEAGKTALVDVLVNMLFRRSTAQSRFQSRRFRSFEGHVRIEYQGQEIEFTGCQDLDKFLGLPPEFSRLPVVRGSDLAFLWSSNKDKKAPLIDACLQYFSSDLEENLPVIIKGIRNEAGLTPKSDNWTQAKMSQLESILALYRNRDAYLRALAGRERVARAARRTAAELETVGRQLTEVSESLNRLKEEQKSALYAAASRLREKLEFLNRRYRDEGHERYSHADASLWAELDAKRQSLAEKIRSLQHEINNNEAEQRDLRKQLEDMEARCREAEAAFRSAGESLEAARDAAGNRLQARAAALGTLKGLVDTRNTARNQKKKLFRIYLTAPLFAGIGFILFFFRQYLLGGVVFGIATGALAWALAGSNSLKAAEKESDEKIINLLKEYGVPHPGRVEAAVESFEISCREEEDKVKQNLMEAEQTFRKKEGEHNTFVREREALRNRLENLSQHQRSLQIEHDRLKTDLVQADYHFAELVTRTGKPDRGELETALREKMRLETEIATTRARLENCLGPAGSWPERFLELRPFFERCPRPRPVEELAPLVEELETKARRLKEDERALQNRYESLLRQELEVSRDLLAAGCADIGTLASRLTEAEAVLKDTVKRALAALWAQRVIEAAKEDLENALLEPLARAAGIFYRITGRYHTLSYTRQAGDVVFKVAGDGVEYAEEALSDGTKAQFLLSFRLAVLENLLRDEKGFLVLDDPLLNASETRKRRAVAVLLDYVREGWQIFYLTVDGVTANLFQEQGNGVVEVLKVEDIMEISRTEAGRGVQEENLANREGSP